jgi:hypothetical protein
LFARLGIKAEQLVNLFTISAAIRSSGFSFRARFPVDGSDAGQARLEIASQSLHPQPAHPAIERHAPDLDSCRQNYALTVQRQLTVILENDGVDDVPIRSPDSYR